MNYPISKVPKFHSPILSCRLGSETNKKEFARGVYRLRVISYSKKASFNTKNSRTWNPIMPEISERWSWLQSHWRDSDIRGLYTPHQNPGRAGRCVEWDQLLGIIPGWWSKGKFNDIQWQFQDPIGHIMAIQLICMVGSSNFRYLKWPWIFHHFRWLNSCGVSGGVTSAEVGWVLWSRGDGPCLRDRIEHPMVLGIPGLIKVLG